MLNKKVRLLDLDTNEVIDITIVEEKDKDILSYKFLLNFLLGKRYVEHLLGMDLKLYKEIILLNTYLKL
ncbi:hypothetical protein CNEO4_100155 [Clostridium neonatale]|nr:hypothetical protein CNEO_640101 [Clostridium neonatale]CAI3556151.1 hypothetical protein CNEO4_100155 [Clostridium neonatale]